MARNEEILIEIIMFYLSSTVATINPCLIILREKGYTLRIECSRKKSGESVCVYSAETSDRRFAGMSAEELLGLVTLWEHYGENWKRTEPDIWGEVIVNEDEDEDS